VSQLIEIPDRPRWQGSVGRAKTIDEIRERMKLFRTQASDELADRLVARPDDVFIATYPKCGTTLLQQLVHTLRTRGDDDFDEITDVVPWLEMAGDLGVDPGADQIAWPRAFKTHRTANALPGTGRYIHMTRDPFDMADSFYRFLSGWIFEHGSIDKDAFARDMILGGTGSGQYWQHIASWWPKRQQTNVLFLCYEDFIDDPQRIIECVASFVGIALDTELRGITLERTSINYMKRRQHQFDDHNIHNIIDPVMGLPPSTDTSKVDRGGSNKDHRLSDQTRQLFNTRWREDIALPFGVADYAALRQTVRGQTIQAGAC
jgi:hypothetical protein